MRVLYIILGIFATLSLSQGQSCGPTQWMCDNGNCIPVFHMCDGRDQCGDNSDEGGSTGICPKCPSGYFKCDDGSCLMEVSVCDGINNCLDWSDETEYACPCSKDELRCSTEPGSPAAGACVPREKICDEEGNWDCLYGDDEANCNETDTGKPKSLNVEQ